MDVRQRIALSLTLPTSGVLPEIAEIIKERGTPENRWETNIPDNLAPYIEAQVWNREKILQYRDFL